MSGQILVLDGRYDTAKILKSMRGTVVCVLATVLPLLMMIILGVESWWRGDLFLTFFFFTLSAALLFIGLIILGYTSNRFDWIGVRPFEKESSTTEFAESSESKKAATKTTETTQTKTVRTFEHQREKTLWDWLQLLIIPVVIAGATIGFSAAQNAHTEQIAQDQQQEATLRTYIDDISSLMLDKDPRLWAPLPTTNSTPNPESQVRTVARAHTLVALRRLDSARKGLLVQFLYEAGLISRDNTIISLEDADLSEADLRGLDLHAINLYKANLYSAKLDGASLWDAILNNATLDKANLSGAILNGALLQEASLQSANLRKAILADTNLFEADLGGADLSGADLSRADLLYSQLEFTRMTRANLSGSYLGGANLRGADLTDADYTDADFAGANYIDTDRTEHDSNKAKIRDVQLRKATQIKWEVIRYDDNTLLIAHNDGRTLPQYGSLDLRNSALRLKYSLSSNWGTSVDLLPALWSKSCNPNPKSDLPSYCEDGQIVAVSYQDAQRGNVQVTPDTPIGLAAGLNQDPLVLTIHGTIAGLQITSTMTLSPPENSSISAKVETKVEGSVELDTKNHPDAAFQPILLRSMHISSTRWDSQRAFADDQPFAFPFPGDTRITQSPVVVDQRFGLVGGTSPWKTDAPTVEVQKVQLEPAQVIQVTGWINKSTDPTNDNVRFWCAFGQVLPSWSYTLIVSRPQRA
jgi:uncharacterized protein YjbI with pentapeptide repeats